VVPQHLLYTFPGNNHVSVVRILFLPSELAGFCYDVQVSFMSIRTGAVIV